MEGLFGRQNALPYEHPENGTKDTFLEIHKICNPGLELTAYNVVQKFTKGPEFQRMRENVSQRLGFEKVLSAATILVIFDVCRYEKAWAPSQVSAWCAVFSDEDLKILEYRDDLSYYFYTGHGRVINGRVGCVAISDMYNHFRNHEYGNHTQDPKALFYFGHSVSLLSFLTGMGLAKGPILLTPQNFHRMNNRQWRTSLVNPFASNFISILYKCNDTASPLKVRFFLEENPVPYEDCPDGVCDWEYIKLRLGSAVKYCNLDFCFPERDSGSSALSVGFLLLTSLLLVTSRL